MLQKQSVSPKLLELLNAIMAEELFQDFVLVGGTSLALQLGHRNSVDIDLFGASEIDDIAFRQTLSGFGETVLLKKSKNILILSVAGIKVDFVNYQYPWIEPIVSLDTVRLAGKKDIAAMKLNAITGRGSKKDLIDIYFLLKHFSLAEMMEFYQQKYADGSEFLVIKSLTYFDDADREEMPVMYSPVKWDTIKKEIANMVK